MLRWLVILAVVGVMAAVGIVASQTSPANTPEKGVAAEGAGGTRSEQAKPQQNEADSPYSAVRNVQASADTNQNKTEAEQENLDIQRKLEWFTGALAVVGVLQVCLMFWQGWLLHLTGKTIHLQTQAAASTAASFINKERSRLFISHDITPDFVVTIKAVNRGLSPARVTYKYVGSEFYRPTEGFRPEIPRDTEPGEPPEDYVCDEWVLPGKPRRSENATTPSSPKPITRGFMATL